MICVSVTTVGTMYCTDQCKDKWQPRRAISCNLHAHEHGHADTELNVRLQLLTAHVCMASCGQPQIMACILCLPIIAQCKRSLIEMVQNGADELATKSQVVSLFQNDYTVLNIQKHLLKKEIVRNCCAYCYKSTRHPGQWLTTEL